ncbi:MAG: hypothetical protein K8R88_14970 [Armatimonadetes bacterium]|nr:hypothetical protein [Armatimonadota bacterium]
MSRLALRFSLLAGLCVLAAPVSAKGADKHAMALEQELQLAASEGLPTTAAEFEKYLPAKILGENAATYYLQLTKIRPRSWMPLTLLSDSIYDPLSIGRAKEFLRSKERELALIDTASRFSCRFERDWSLGAAVLFPEMTELKNGAQLVLLRGNVAAAEGRFGDAILAAEQAERIERHIRTEPTLISQLVANSITSIIWRNLAALAFRYHGHAEFTKALQRSMSAIAPPDLKSMYRFSLVELLSTIELCRTKEGRAKVGLTLEDDKDQTFGVALMTYVTRNMTEAQAKLTIVRESRSLWHEIVHPGPQSLRKNGESKLRLFKGLAKFPSAMVLTEALGSLQEDPYGFVLRDRAKRLAYRGVLRALREPVIPSSLDLRDLRSPIDGSPMQYAFDGERLEVAIRDSGGEDGRIFRLTFPPKPKPVTK